MLTRTSEGYLVEVLAQVNPKVNQTLKLGKFGLIKRMPKNRIHKNNKIMNILYSRATAHAFTTKKLLR